MAKGGNEHLLSRDGVSGVTWRGKNERDQHDERSSIARAISICRHSFWRHSQEMRFADRASPYTYIYSILIKLGKLIDQMSE